MGWHFFGGHLGILAAILNLVLLSPQNLKIFSLSSLIADRLLIFEILQLPFYDLDISEDIDIQKTA